MTISIHPTSVVDEGAEIGDGTRIWHFSHISSGSIIGRDVSLGQNVYVSSTAVIGDHCKIQNNVSVYDEVVLEDYVFCGPSVVFTNVYNPRAGVPRKQEYRKTLVRHGATLGANSTIICGVTIGRYAFIAAGSVVRSDVPDYALIVGVPGRHAGWMSEYGERLDLPLAGSSVAECAHTGDIYQMKDGIVARVN